MSRINTNIAVEDRFLQDDVGTPSKERRMPRWVSKRMPSELKIAQPLEQRAARPHDDSQDYLTGLRGVLVIMSWLWVFMQTFVPAAVKGSANTTGPGYQLALRKSLSVLFWNDSMIYSSIIFLSARMICLPFLMDSSKTMLAGCVVRRGLRLWFPTAAALVICYATFTKHLGNQYLYDFASKTFNVSMVPGLALVPTSLANFNSIFEIFWVSHTFQTQAGNWAFPTQTLWMVSAIFQQSYTVYTAMVVIPYTLTRWRVMGAFVFILTAWWVYSWAWFSISGLLFADAVVNMGMRPGQNTSFKFANLRIPFWALGVFCMAVGYAMQFIWVAVRPDLENTELYYHTALYSSGGLNWGVDTTTSQLRADNYLVIIGFFFILETTQVVQNIFQNPFFIYLGKRSYSWFLLQSIIIYTLGITLCNNTMGDNLDLLPKGAGIAFIVCLIVTAAASEVFFWLIDWPSQKFARLVFDWLVT